MMIMKHEVAASPVHEAATVKHLEEDKDGSCTTGASLLAVG
jgi:hypothetical protein